MVSNLPIARSANTALRMAGLLGAAGSLALEDAALAFARAGVAVFPCVAGGKRPRTRHGLLDATTDPGQVADWWARWPQANIGLATGDHVEVVDVDHRPAGSGFVPLERARTAGLTERWACIVRTPSWGLHLYYPVQPGRPQRSWAEASVHVDFRGTGGYVLVPPSRIVAADGEWHGYELIATGRDAHPIDAVALRTLLRPRRRPRPTPTGPRAGDVDGRRLATWLASQPEGNRNQALFWAACRYAEQHLPEDQAHELLGVAAQRAGLSETETITTIRSAYRSAGLPTRSDHARAVVDR